GSISGQGFGVLVGRHCHVRFSWLEDKKNRQAFGTGGFSRGFGGVSLAGPFRQQAREVKEKTKEETGKAVDTTHGGGFNHEMSTLVYLGHRIICVHRKRARRFPLASILTSASHT